jgi:pSer/pThr/pTyr-binding forkhead associated (FHA) protein
MPAPSVDDQPTRTEALPLPPTAATAAAAPGPPTQADVAGVYLRLVAVEGDGDRDLSAVVLAGNEPLVLGRSREAPLQVDDRQASARHCGFVLDPVDRELQVEDLGSTNGTFVDGRRVEHSTLAPGTTLRVGASTWRVEVEPV